MRFQLLALGLASLTTAQILDLAPSVTDSLTPRSPAEQVTFKPCKHTHPTTDPAQVLAIDFTPNPPQAGADLHIAVRAALRQRLEQGAALKLSVKMGLIPVLGLSVDVCKWVPGGCPVEPGEWAMNYTQALDAGVPTGVPFAIKVDVEDKEGERMACVKIPDVQIAAKEE